MQKQKGLQTAEASAALQFPQTRAMEVKALHGGVWGAWGTRGASPPGAALLALWLQARPVPPDKLGIPQGSLQPARSSHSTAGLSSLPAKVWGGG